MILLKKSVQMCAFTISTLSLVMVCEASTTSFVFISFTNGSVLDNQPSGTVIDGAFQLDMAASPAGSLFYVGIPGMGINSAGLASVTDADTDKISIPGGSSPGISGISESVTFSFNRNGVLRDLHLDGLKDENLEYAILTLPDNSVISIFDIEVPNRLAEQGFDLSHLTAPNISLGSGGSDDDNLVGLNASFLAGQTFTLSFAVEPAPIRQDGNDTITYVPADSQAPNGYRLEAIFVVPEPSSIALTMGYMILIMRRRGRSAAN